MTPVSYICIWVVHLKSKLSGAISLVIFPLVSIEQQARKVCENWGIPYLSLDETKPEDILSTLEAMEEKPRVIIATISRLSLETVQKHLLGLPIVTIGVDEAQVQYTWHERWINNHHPRWSTQTKRRDGQVFFHMGTHQHFTWHLFGSPLALLYSGKIFGTGLEQRFPRRSTACALPRSPMRACWTWEVLQISATPKNVYQDMVTLIFQFALKGSLGIERSNLKILFKENRRENIYLQVCHGHILSEFVGHDFRCVTTVSSLTKTSICFSPSCLPSWPTSLSPACKSFFGGKRS